MRPICSKDGYGFVSCRLGKTNFVNLTPHKITLQTNKGAISIPPSGKVLRLKTEEKVLGKIENVPAVRIRYTTPEEEPPKRENTYYIVSTPVVEHYYRSDFIASDTSLRGVVRDIEGGIIGTKRWRMSCRHNESKRK